MDLLPDDEYYAQLNVVNLASGALIRNCQGEVLIVNPTYREHWLIPGGCVDKDESPLETCKREVREELGLDLPIQKLLSIEYLARRDYKPEAVHFIFDGGVVSDEQIAAIDVCSEELSEMLFCSIERACELLDSSLAVRFRAAWNQINHKGMSYLERGEEL